MSNNYLVFDTLSRVFSGLLVFALLLLPYAHASANELATTTPTTTDASALPATDGLANPVESAVPETSADDIPLPLPVEPLPEVPDETVLPTPSPLDPPVGEAPMEPPTMVVPEPEVATTTPIELVEPEILVEEVIEVEAKNILPANFKGIVKVPQFESRSEMPKLKVPPQRPEPQTILPPALIQPIDELLATTTVPIEEPIATTTDPIVVPLVPEEPADPEVTPEIPVTPPEGETPEISPEPSPDNPVSTTTTELPPKPLPEAPVTNTPEDPDLVLPRTDEDDNTDSSVPEAV